MAKEYIERDKAYELARTSNYYSDFHKSMADLTSLKELLDDTPAADVVEVRHGEWLPDIDREYDYHCSLCRGSAGKGDYGNYDVLYDFCPNCGAKMTEKGKQSDKL